MNTTASRIDAALRSLGELSPPPPSPALLALARDPRPVARVAPGRSLALVFGASLFVVAVHVHSHCVRRDLAALPRAWFWATALAWLAAFAAPLAIALVPRRGAMWADTRAARAAAVAVPVVAIALSLLLRVDAAPATRLLTDPAKVREELEWCLVTGLEMNAVPFALGVMALRRAPLPLHLRWIGAALGAANGALAGLMLHLACDVGGALHAGVSHAGHAVIGSIAGAWLVPTLARPRS